MEKIILASIAICAVSSVSLPSHASPPVYVPPPLPVFTWTGFYAGLNAGYAFDGDHSYNTIGNNPGAGNTINAIALGLRPGFFRNRSDGFTGGGQVGYNYQLGNPPLQSGHFVVGVEADVAYTDLNASGSYVSPSDPTHVSNFRSTTDFVGTVRGRVGYAFDNILAYGTGGFAYGGVNDNIAFVGLGPNNFGGSRDVLRLGYAYGGGIEYALPTTSFLNFFHSSAVTLREEFIHYDLGTSTLVLPNSTGTANSYTTQIRVNGNLVRAGINYRFDTYMPITPVVAKYEPL
jgi:outer membrane immunogenic protein